MFLPQVTSPLAESERYEMRDLGSKWLLYSTHPLPCACRHPTDTISSTRETENHQFCEQPTLKRYTQRVSHCVMSARGRLNSTVPCPYGDSLCRWFIL